MEEKSTPKTKVTEENSMFDWESEKEATNPSRLAQCLQREEEREVGLV